MCLEVLAGGTRRRGENSLAVANQTYPHQQRIVMPRLHGYRQRLHQHFWDTLIRTRGNPTTALVNGTRLFGNANIMA